MKANIKRLLGWLAVLISLIFSCIWAVWGTIENFHEGWYSLSLWENLFMFFFQYLLISLILVIAALLSLKWRIAGVISHLVLAGSCAWFFFGSHFSVIGLLIVIPLVGLGFLYYFGTPQPKKWAYLVLILIPSLIILALSIPQGIKIAQRVNDEDFGIRIVEGNGVSLAFAPRGPGWPDQGTTWEEAMEIVKYLAEDGLTLLETEQNIWRLPTVEEAVRSMMHHNVNAGGVYDSLTATAMYEFTPDKETPIWDPHSQVIYYWTSDTRQDDDRYAYIIVYHGGVFSKRKTDGQDYLSFRAVKSLEPSDSQ
ncbi:MAG: hypothetical protein WCR28_05690 [Candidatus Izemoplasmatales bacterium]